MVNTTADLSPSVDQSVATATESEWKNIEALAQSTKHFADIMSSKSAILRDTAPAIASAIDMLGSNNPFLSLETSVNAGNTAQLDAFASDLQQFHDLVMGDEGARQRQAYIDDGELSTSQRTADMATLEKFAKAAGALAKTLTAAKTEEISLELVDDKPAAPVKTDGKTAVRIWKPRDGQQRPTATINRKPGAAAASPGPFRRKEATKTLPPLDFTLDEPPTSTPPHSQPVQAAQPDATQQAYELESAAAPATPDAAPQPAVLESLKRSTPPKSRLRQLAEKDPKSGVIPVGEEGWAIPDKRHFWDR